MKQSLSLLSIESSLKGKKGSGGLQMSPERLNKAFSINEIRIYMYIKNAIVSLTATYKPRMQQ